jgi:hypothetical protein
VSATRERPEPREALSLEVARILLAWAREHPPPWPEPDPTEDLDEPAIVRKQRRQRRRAEG